MTELCVFEVHYSSDVFHSHLVFLPFLPRRDTGTRQTPGAPLVVEDIPTVTWRPPPTSPLRSRSYVSPTLSSFVDRREHSSHEKHMTDVNSD